jgi:hypothetical protein
VQQDDWVGRVQDHTALEMAKARAEIVKSGGDVIDFKAKKSKI